MWTAGIQMKWVCDHRSESQFKQLRKSPEKRKDFGASTGFEPVASGLALVIYQPELWRPIHWRPANLLSSSTRERNETQNEMMWTAGIQMKWVCDHRSEPQLKPEKKDFGASTRFEPVASALALQCSTNLSYEDPYTLEAGQFIEFISPWKERNTMKWCELREYKWNEYRNPFFRAFSQLLELRFPAMVTYSFHLYSCSSHHFILCFIPFTGWWTQ